MLGHVGADFTPDEDLPFQRILNCVGEQIHQDLSVACPVALDVNVVDLDLDNGLSTVPMPNVMKNVNFLVHKLEEGEGPESEDIGRWGDGESLGLLYFVAKEFRLT